ncbi:MAG: glycoside hydrolase, partial [Bryobacteraceae bacterium]
LYRSHLANVYRFLNLAPPEEISRPILRIALPAVLLPPTGPIRPMIDGDVTSYFEWMGAGVYHVDERSGSMHGKKFLVKEVYFGSDGQSFYLRIDLNPGYGQEPGGMEARFTGQTLDGARSSQVTIGLVHGAAKPVDVRLAAAADGAVECAFGRVLEVRILLAALGIADGQGMRFQASLWEGGLPVEAIPNQGWLEMKSTDPAQFGD